MSGTVSTRWYFSDWMSDMNVRACSLAARGLWMDLLSIASANKGRDHGFVMVAGRVMTAKEISRQVGATEDEVSVLLIELENNAVFSRDRRGAIYSRRMVRSEINRRNGRLGGNPNLLKDKGNQNSLQPTPKAHIPEPEPMFSNENITRAKKVPRAKGGFLPADWQPKESHYAKGAKLGFNHGQIDAFAEQMRDWAGANSHRDVARKANWDLAFNNWIANRIARSGPTPGGSRNEANRNGYAVIAEKIIRKQFADAELFDQQPAAGFEPADRH